MIEFTSTVTIRSITLKSKTKDGVTERRIRLTIERAFDDDLAQSLGADAKRTRKLLSDSALAKAEIPLDAIEAEMKIKNVESTRLRIPAVKGVRAVAKAPASVGAEMPPSIALLWDFPFSDDSVVFLANALGQTVSVEVTPRQLELIKQETNRSPMIRAAAAQAAGTLTRELVEECRRYVEKRDEKLPVELRAALARFKLLDGAERPEDGSAPLPNPVLTAADLAAELADDRAAAATPEDAEAARSERLMAEKIADVKVEADFYSPAIVQLADLAMVAAVVEELEDMSGAPYFLATLTTGTGISEAEGDTRPAALAALRAKVLDVLHEAEQDAGAVVGKLKAPAGSKAKVHKGAKS